MKNTTLKNKIISMLIMLTMLIGMVPISGFVSYAEAISEYETILAGEEKTVTLNGSTDIEKIFEFTPTEDGVYNFYSYDQEYDTYGIILDGDGVNQLDFDDDSGEGSNFLVSYEMTAGVKYLLKSKFYITSNNGSYKLKVEKRVDATSISIDVGDTYTGGIADVLYINCISYPGHSYTGYITYTSSDNDVVSVDDSGVVRLIKPGVATVTATPEHGTPASIVITVLDPIEIVPDTEYTIIPGDSSVTYSFTPTESGFYNLLTHDSTYYVNSILFVIEDNTFVFLNSHGDTTVDLKHNLTAGKTYYYLLKDYENNNQPFAVELVKMVDATSLTINKSSLDIYVGHEETLEVLFAPSNSIPEEVTWTSSDDTVVSVNGDGDIVALKEGTATITATSENGLTASCVLSVSDFSVIPFHEKVGVTISDSVTKEVFSFTPEVDGKYALISSNNTDGCDPKAYLYKDYFNSGYINYSDDFGEEYGRNFRVEYNFTAGVKYVFEVVVYGENYGSFDIYIVEIDDDNNEVHNYGEYVCDDESHEISCIDCGKTISGNHTLDESYTCTVCEYVHNHSIEYSYSSVYHWGDCTGCDLYVEEDHTFDENNNCDCGYIYHEHVFDVYEYSYSTHWMICSACGLYDEITGELPHEYNEDFVCECGREKVVGIYIFGIHLNDGEYIDNYGNVTTTVPQGGYAYYKDGVLTLNNFEAENSDEFINEESSVLYSESDITLNIVGTNKLVSYNDDGIYVLNANLTINGDGSLYIFAYDDYDGIDVNNGKLVINSGSLFIDATDHGIEVYGETEINGGLIKISADDDGMDVDDLVINDGIFYIDAEDNGIDAGGNLEINGGYFSIFTNNYNGIEISYDCVINGGIFDLDTDGGCIDVAGTLYINGGVFSLNARNGYAAIRAGLEIGFGEAMGEQNVVCDEYGNYVWSYDDEEMITCEYLTPTGCTSESLIKDYWITYDNFFIYNGNVQTPFIEVYDEYREVYLTPGVDFKVEIVGTEVKSPDIYYALVSGIGNYHGAQLIHFSVHECIEVAVGETTSVNITDTFSNVYTFVKFVPRVSATYSFAFKTSEELNVYLLDPNYEYNNGEGRCWSSADGTIYFEVELEAGVTYYLDVFTNSVDAMCDVTVNLICREHVGGQATYHEQAICSICGEHYGEILVCNHMCHKGGIYAVVWDMFMMIYDILGVESHCECGDEH